MERVPEPTELISNNPLIKKYEKLDAKRYKRKSSSYRIVSEDILKKIDIKEGKVLDVGSGYGGLIGVLNEYLPKMKYIGIDGSDWIIKFSKKLHKKNTNIKFIKSFAEKMPFEKETFDLVLCRDAIHHFKNPLKILKEMYRVTKSGGLIYIVDLRRDLPEKVIYHGLWSFFNEMPTIAVNYLYSIRASYTIGEIKKLFKKAKIKGFKIQNFGMKKPYNYFSMRWIAVIEK